MNPFQGGWVILASLAVAMVLSVVHLPEWWPQWLGWFRPAWMVLVVFYWVMALPHRVGLISAWCVGLLADVLFGDPLGVNGICLAALTFLTWSFYERFRMYSVAQQGALVFVVVLAMEIVRLFAQMFGRSGSLSWMVLWTAIASTLAWPLVYLALRRVRRQFEVS